MDRYTVFKQTGTHADVLAAVGAADVLRHLEPVMGMEQIAVPDWFELRSAQQAQLWLQTLEEHDAVLRRLNDSHSDEFELLKQYRRTLQIRWEESVREFVEFLVGYGAFLFKRRAQDQWLLPQLTTLGVIPILKRDPELRMMMRNPGIRGNVSSK